MPTQTIEHIQGTKNRINLLERLRKFLKENGILFFTTHERKTGLKRFAEWTLKEFFSPFKKSKEEVGDIWIESTSPNNKLKNKMFLHFYSKKEALREIKLSNLKLLEIVKSSKFPIEDWVGKTLKYTFVCKRK